MSLGPLAQSADKQVLFARLGLNEQIHKLLLLEAQVARDTLSRNPLYLTDQSKADPNVATPYKWDEISETAKHLEILTVVNNARQETRPYYHLGRYMTNVNEENWVARWYLWHSFRYRDNRPRSTANNGSEGYGGGQGPYGAGYYDPARERYR
ncbi:uncharacterized protein K460DRAFT_405540 [Cucurbitaria berberidis CBS 394.84]|uniref:Uncharacterized protein n=1 Tax=Cucurbitaria berberidis CBS 394.84 TaxID=1168544 RepID=A0A9P4GHF7_9PLEO|nr:uncharacterized protein K460DRAFT_405540 [Cucurbitaria berberidis CBS 394.84]KAF1845276.1 hypothetical protein K460DRAFT_405540 [Cucurbitaria berberidis CBS 394.84]